MASHHHRHHPHNHHQTSPPSTNCCCNPSSHLCCTPPHLSSPLPSHDHLVQTIASLLSQQHLIIPTHQYPKSHTHNTLLNQTYNHQHETHSTISSLLHRIESLESSLNHHIHTKNSSYSSHSLRHTAARIIQIHFRSFLVRRSKTLRHLKHLAFIKSTFNALRSSFSNDAHLDFVALSHKAMDLLLQLDSIEGCDPMVMDGKRSITRDLVQFLDSIERVATKKHLFYVKPVKNVRFGQKVNKSRDSSDDEKRKMLQNLRGRVEKISRLCKVSANDEDSEPEGIHHVGGDDDDDVGVPSVLIGRRNGRFGQKVNKSRDSSDDEKRKLLQNLRGRVDKISRLCKVPANDDDSEPEGIRHVGGDDSDNDVGVSSVISRRNGLSSDKNGIFIQRQGVQPRVKKNVRFAENGKFSDYSTYEPDLSGDVACLGGSSSSDDQGEVLENVDCAVEDGLDSSQGAEDDEEALVENGGSRLNSNDGEKNSTRELKSDGRNIVKGQLQTHQEKLLFSAPLPLKMENKAELMKSKGVRILT